MKSKPKKLRSKFWRDQARFTRDRQWEFMEKAAQVGTLWFCVWNKDRKPTLPDEWRDGLITGLEIQGWMERHPQWFVVGEWDDDRYARPVQLTDAGHAALRNREHYDMEPVDGGLVEPGWTAIPAGRA